jgi:hypothetical protein
MKGKKDTYLLRSEGPNVRIKSRREDKARRKEEKDDRRRKTLSGPDENRLPFQAQKGVLKTGEV